MRYKYNLYNDGMNIVWSDFDKKCYLLIDNLQYRYI